MLSWRVLWGISFLPKPKLSSPAVVGGGRGSDDCIYFDEACESGARLLGRGEGATWTVAAIPLRKAQIATKGREDAGRPRTNMAFGRRRGHPQRMPLPGLGCGGSGCRPWGFIWVVSDLGDGCSQLLIHPGWPARRGFGGGWGLHRASHGGPIPAPNPAAGLTSCWPVGYGRYRKLY